MSPAYGHLTLNRIRNDDSSFLLRDPSYEVKRSVRGVDHEATLTRVPRPALALQMHTYAPVRRSHAGGTLLTLSGSVVYAFVGYVSRAAVSEQSRPAELSRRDGGRTERSC